MKATVLLGASLLALLIAVSPAVAADNSRGWHDLLTSRQIASKSVGADWDFLPELWRFTSHPHSIAGGKALATAPGAAKDTRIVQTLSGKAA